MSSKEGSRLAWAWLGRRGYREVWELQEALRARVIAGDADAERLLFVEHPPTITLGRAASESDILAPGDAEVVRSSRGGAVTAHGPGQLVIYPVVRLRGGIVQHLETIAGALISEVAARGVAGATWRRDPVGVFVGAKKLAACGVHVSRRVAIHGFALNVTVDSERAFASIVPCGVRGAEVTSIERAIDRSPPELATIASSIAGRLARAWRSTAILDATI